MRVSSQMKGLRSSIGALAGASALTRQGVVRGLKKGGLFLQRESQKVCPADTGTLRNSAFTRETRVDGEPAVNVGYTAVYALYVHEMPASYNFQAPGTGPKFLENPAKEHKDRIVRIVQREAKL